MVLLHLLSTSKKKKKTIKKDDDEMRKKAATLSTRRQQRRPPPALTGSLIKIESALTHLINPRRQLPRENRPHYARAKTMTPSAGRDSS